jgi:hypothetical protein
MKSAKPLIVILTLFLKTNLFVNASMQLSSPENFDSGEIIQSFQDKNSYLITSIGSQSIKAWASLWDDDSSPIRLKKMDFSIDENLTLFDLWTFRFFYKSYSETPNANIYLDILLEAQEKVLNSCRGNSLREEYSITFLKDIIGSIK